VYLRVSLAKDRKPGMRLSPLVLTSGGVLLLRFVQDGVVDQACLANENGQRNKNRSFIQLIEFFQRICIGDCYIVETSKWFSFNRRANQVGDPVGTSLALFVRGLSLDQRAMNYGR